MSEYDEAIQIIKEYICNPPEFNKEAYDTARICLADALGCAIAALQFNACTKLLGPFFPGSAIEKGCRIPGTHFRLDPIQAAFNLGIMIRWLDYNDTWLAAEWGHPSDNIGGLLPLADYLCRNGKKYLMQDLFKDVIQAYEIQGNIALHNSFNRVGLDHVILVKVATAGIAAKMLGGSEQQILSALSNAWIDLGPLRVYRHSPNTGSRKSWAAGDATSRGIQLAQYALKGEMGYKSPLTTPKWGLYDVFFKGKPFVFSQPLNSYVIENILFKISYPAEFHAQTAVEAAVELHPLLQNKWDEINSIEIVTHESAIRIIDKKGVLKNPADRDHCLQYMVAIALLHGNLEAVHYEDNFAKDPRIDKLRSKMSTIEDPQYSKDYLDPSKRSIANAIRIKMKDGSTYGPISKEYPLGHKKRRSEGNPKIFQKFENNLKTAFSETNAKSIVSLFQHHDKLSQMTVSELIDHFV